jgi:hypothetical protein
MKARYFLEQQIIVPITVFVVTTADSKEIELVSSQRRGRPE